MEVWIEIQIVVKVFLIPSVTSLAEVWIEMFKSLAPLGISQVTSLAEVWIEIVTIINAAVSSASLPLRKCGLK